MGATEIVEFSGTKTNQMLLFQNMTPITHTFTADYHWEPREDSGNTTRDKGGRSTSVNGSKLSQKEIRIKINPFQSKIPSFMNHEVDTM